MAVDWMWSGGVTYEAATVVAKLTASAASCRLKVGAAFSAAAVPDADNYVKLSLAGLDAGTDYSYQVEIDGVLDAKVGGFRTHPAAGTLYSFTFAFGSCQLAGLDLAVFDAIRGRNPDLMVQTGDFHYGDVNANDQPLYRAALEAMFTGSAKLAQLYREVAVAYTWDDHDYANNDANGSNPGRPAAANVYRQTVPHYTLPAGAGDNPIYQAFTVGRVRFILTDNRHARSVNSLTDDDAKTMLGPTQKAWFKQQMLDAVSAGQVICWVNGQPWNGVVGSAPYDTSDSWAQFNTERTELTNFMAANGVAGNIFIVSGDMHAVAIDDGSNSPGGIPIFHAAPIAHNLGNLKNGPYFYGANAVIAAGEGHFGLVTITDDAAGWSIRWEGIHVGSTGTETVKKEMSLRLGGSWIDRPVKVWTGTEWVERATRVYDGTTWVERPMAVASSA